MNASIIITTYNRPRFLVRAIESCLKQETQYPYEIIVVDDNGLATPMQKETETILSDYKNKIVYLPLEKNSGACVARNKGAEIAQGEYIFFLDDDDEFLPDKIEVQTKFLEDNPNYAGCLTGFKRIQLETNTEIKAASNFPVVGSFTNFVINGNFFTPMLAIRKKLLLQMGGFESIPRFQDRFLMLKALKQGLSFATLPQQLHIMYEHSGDRITEASIQKSYQSLDTIRTFVEKEKQQFTNEEWKRYELKDLRMRGTIAYVSERYRTRLSAIPYFFKAFLLSFQTKDLKALIKSILKFRK